jgi:hypothetical protein
VAVSRKEDKLVKEISPFWRQKKRDHDGAENSNKTPKQDPLRTEFFSHTKVGTVTETRPDKLAVQALK